MFFSYTLCSAGLCGTVLFQLLCGSFSICTDSCILSLAPQYIPMIWLLCFYCLTTQYKLNIRLCIMQCLMSIAWQYILANSKWVYNSLKAWQKAQELCRLQFFLVPHMIIYYPPPDWMSWGDCGVYKGLHSYILFVQFCWWMSCAGSVQTHMSNWLDGSVVHSLSTPPSRPRLHGSQVSLTDEHPIRASELPKRKSVCVHIQRCSAMGRFEVTRNKSCAGYGRSFPYASGAAQSRIPLVVK